MEKEAKKLVSRLTPWIFLLVVPLLYVDIMWSSKIKLEQRLHYSPPATISNKTVEVNSNSLDFLLSRLVQEEDQKNFRSTGFSCDAQGHSKHCVTNRAVRIDTATMTVSIPSGDTVQETWLRPYARQEDEILLQKVTPVKIVQGNMTPPVCDHSHGVPAVVFSSSGFTGNVFHEINEIIIPLFITARQFNSRVLLVMEDYRPSFVEKYGKLLAHLTSYEILNPAANRSVHCFPAAVVGLKFHGHLSLNSSDIPRGLSTADFRQFLRQSLNLRYSHVSQIKRPTVMLLSRTTTRRIINEDEVVAMMEDLGFRVVVVRRAKMVSNINIFSGMINSCSVFVGVHGAGLTNELFLAEGAVMVQVDLIGLEWAAATYYGDPARAMGVHYLRYKIEAEESSLLKIFGSSSHKAFTDPRAAFPVQAGKEVYLNGQNVNISVDRFRHTMAMAMSLVQD
ncbi:alpha-1,3-arabinosyltransferase XAT3-like [Salvia miltiorrhiza]|uniref:alpha-1,3-arabinosyltransferase XAT3-like n=1 Tax=Salvia miltiorrhiza TaxID=226208 RepID=UPI0025AD6B67|nr:alpha-1,3-arabinosyltransferase XAT3-like [Salvia miltiorrhiza]